MSVLLSVWPSLFLSLSPSFCLSLPLSVCLSVSLPLSLSFPLSLLVFLLYLHPPSLQQISQAQRAYTCLPAVGCFCLMCSWFFVSVFDQIFFFMFQSKNIFLKHNLFGYRKTLFYVHKNHHNLCVCMCVVCMHGVCIYICVVHFDVYIYAYVVYVVCVCVE